MAESIRRDSTLGGAVIDQGAESHRLIVADCLLRAGHITRGQRDEAARWLDRHPQGFVTEFLLKRNYIENGAVAEVLSRQYNFPLIDLAGLSAPPEILALMPYELARKHMAIPYHKKGNKLHLAMLEPTNRRMLEDLSARLGRQLMPGVAAYQDLIDAFKRLYDLSDDEYRRFSAPLGPQDAAGQDSLASGDLRSQLPGAAFAFGEAGEEAVPGDIHSAGNGAIINLANHILLQAVGEGASDIHIEPFEKQVHVRYRIDGVLHRHASLPLEIKNALVARLKIMARLDLTERRAPQDGRLGLRVSKAREIDFRVSTLPTLFGESVVLRILDKSGPSLDLGQLGLTRKNLDQLRSAINRPGGLILVTGPAGSGKTVTLHSCLSPRNTDGVKILTAEDPAEFNLPGVSQIDLAKAEGLTFAKALKAFLRQDPDICLIGEIRDRETAELAVEAAMTGRLVLSALHTSDAPSTITRLLDMGVPALNLAASLALCSAQRLVRRICPDCRRALKPLPADKLIEAGFDRGQAGDVQLYEGRGCPNCKGSGYKGRLGIFEIMEMTDALAEAIAARVPESQLRRIALKEGMSTLRQDGLLKASQGLTTLDQVLEKTVRLRGTPPLHLLNQDEVLEKGDALRAAPALISAAARPLTPWDQARTPALRDLAAFERDLAAFKNNEVVSGVPGNGASPGNGATPGNGAAPGNGGAPAASAAAPPLPPPDQTRAPTPKDLAAAEPMALRITASEAPKARELKPA
jgi:type IV pilus assembly protein PilB